MRKTIKCVSILLCILNVFGAVFGPYYLYVGFKNSTLYQWLDQCDTVLAVWGIVIISTIILLLSAACLTTSILMPYSYERIYGFIEGIVYKWFSRKQNDTKEEPKIQVTLIKSNPGSKVVVKERVVPPTITDLDHVAEVIAGGAFDSTKTEKSIKTPKINNVESGKHYVDNFDKLFPMTASNYYTWSYANEVDCERILKSMFKDDKRVYFYEKKPKDRENLLLGIQTTDNKWRIIRNENPNTKEYDYCIYDYFENKHYLLIDPIKVNMNGKENNFRSYISLYTELVCLYLQ